MALPEVTARLDADVSGFIAAWDRAADAAERAAARIRAAQQGLGDIDIDTSSFGDLNRELERMTRTLRQTTDQIREFGNNTRNAGGGLDDLAERARNAGNALGGSGSGGGGGGLGGAMSGLSLRTKALLAGLALLIPILPAVAAGALALGAAFQGLMVVAGVVIAGWRGIEQAGERLKASLGGLQKQLESVFRAELSKEFQKLGQAISTLDGPLKAIARSTSDVIKAFTGWIRSAEGMRQIEAMLGGVDNMMKSLAPGAKALAQAFTAFGEAAAPAMDEIGAALSSVFENLNKVIQKGKETGQLEKAFKAGATAIEAFGEILAGVVDILIEMAASGGEPAAEALKKFGQALQDSAPLIGAFFHALATLMNIIMTVVGWLAKLVSALDPLVEGFNQAVDGIDNFMKALDPSKIEELQKAIVGFAAKLAVDIKKGVDEAIKAVQKFGEDVKKNVKQFVDDVIKNVKKWWEDTKKAVKDGVDDAIKNVKKFGEDVKKNVKQFVDDVIKNVKKWWEDTKKAVKDGVDKVIEDIKKFVDELPDVIKDGIDQFLSEVEKWWEDTKKAVEEGVTGVIETVKELPQKCVDALNPWAGDMEQAGKDAGDGLEEGLKSTTSKLVATATAIAKAAMAAIKGALGISSPSIEMRDQVGRWIPEGIAEGIIGNAGAVTDAMQRTGMGALAAGRGANALGGAGLGRGGGQTVTIQVLGGSDSAAGTFIARLAQQGKLKITANAIVGGRR